MFLGLPVRFIGVVLAKASTSMGAARSPSVSMKLGGTLLTVMPRSAYSSASALVSPMTPPLEAT